MVTGYKLKLGLSLLMLLVVLSPARLAAADSGEYVPTATGGSPSQRMLARVAEALSKSRCGGIFLYHGRRTTATSDGVSIDLAPNESAVPGHSSVLDYLRRFMSSNPTIRIAQQPSRLVTMEGEHVWQELLQVKIKHVQFKETDRYGPDDAIDGLMSNSEVVSAMQQFRARLGVRTGGISGEIDIRAPHLPADLRDVTVREVLERIATTFKVLVVYAECETSDGEHLFNIWRLPE